jgi:hypothetical protein
MMKLVNLAPNFHRADFNNRSVWFSYDVPIAYKDGNGKTIIRQNEWGPTTGKHLNVIDGGDKKSRMPGNAFNRVLEGCHLCQG